MSNSLSGEAIQVLIGRAAELGVIQELLDDVCGGTSRVLVLRGQPGIGKTALLRAAAERAEKGGMRLAQATAVQVEVGFDFAGLHQLLAPFTGGLLSLPDRQRAGLEAAFGLGAGAGSGQFMAGLGTLTLLTDAAEEQPVLCVVDDAHWLDRASLEVLAFVARRLLADRVGIIFAARTGADRAEALSALPEMRLRALPSEAGRELLELAAGGYVPETASRRILAEAAGHPLALIELGRELREGRLLSARTPPGLPLRVGERLESLYRERMGDLPPAARQLLLLAAAEHAGDADLVWRAAGSLGVDPEAALLPAVRRMLSLSPRVEFAHPLMRTAAYWGSTPGERRRAHAALAEASDPLASPSWRALHRSQAVDGPDETVARDLEASAGRASLAGLSSRSELLQLAARLSADPSRRALRLLAAAEAGLVAGDHATAASLAEEAEHAGTLPSGPLSRARVLRVRAHHACAEGQLDEGVELLVAAALLIGEADPRRARETLLEGCGAARYKGWLKTAEVLRHLPPPPGKVPSDGLLEGFAILRDGPATEAYDLLRSGIESLALVPDWSGSGAAILVPWIYAAALLFDHTALADLGRRIPGFRDHGEMAALSPALYSLGYTLLRVGDLDAASAALAEGRALSEAIGDRGWSQSFSAVEVHLLGLRGEVAEGRALAERLHREPFPAQWRDILHAGTAVLELGVGKYRAALTAALSARALWPLLSPEDAVEAAMRCGLPDVAGSAVAEFAPAAEAADPRGRSGS